MSGLAIEDAQSRTRNTRVGKFIEYAPS
jgi:hypothetical protein